MWYSRAPQTRNLKSSPIQVRVPPIPDLAGPGIGPGDGRESARGKESPIPDLAGIGKQGIPDSRFGWERSESGSRLAANLNREIGDARLCEYSMHDGGLDVQVALSPCQ